MKRHRSENNIETIIYISLIIVFSFSLSALGFFEYKKAKRTEELTGKSITEQIGEKTGDFLKELRIKDETDKLLKGFKEGFNEGRDE